MRRRSDKQLDLPVPAGWGGKREGAGRARMLERPSPPHVSRPQHDSRHPVHVTLRARQGLVSLRSERVFAVLVRALERSNRFSLRIIHYSIQQDHVHLIVEADGARALDRGLRGLTVRTARAINRTLGRSGQVWNQRYHAARCAVLGRSGTRWLTCCSISESTFVPHRASIRAARGHGSMAGLVRLGLRGSSPRPRYREPGSQPPGGGGAGEPSIGERFHRAPRPESLE